MERNVGSLSRHGKVQTGIKGLEPDRGGDVKLSTRMKQVDMAAPYKRSSLTLCGFLTAFNLPATPLREACSALAASTCPYRCILRVAR